MQTDGCFARNKSDEVLGASAKMNLRQQFEQSVAAGRGGSTLQVCAIRWCPLSGWIIDQFCTSSWARLGAVKAVPLARDHTTNPAPKGRAAHILRQTPFHIGCRGS